jgi:hypothetical protein
MLLLLPQLRTVFEITRRRKDFLTLGCRIFALSILDGNICYIIVTISIYFEGYNCVGNIEMASSQKTVKALKFNYYLFEFLEHKSIPIIILSEHWLAAIYCRIKEIFLFPLKLKFVPKPTIIRPIFHSLQFRCRWLAEEKLMNSI